MATFPELLQARPGTPQVNLWSKIFYMTDALPVALGTNSINTLKDIITLHSISDVTTFT